MADTVYVASGAPDPNAANPVAPTLADAVTAAQTQAAGAATAASSAATSASAAAASAAAASAAQSAVTTIESTVVADLATVQADLTSVTNEINGLQTTVATLTGDLGVAESAAAGASAAATTATNAANSASSSSSAATLSATNASASETNALDSANAAAAAVTDRIYGILTADPTTRPDSSTMQDGDLYYNSTASAMKMLISGVWTIVAISASGGSLLSANNLSDLANAKTARQNLGIGKRYSNGDSNFTIPTDARVVATSAAFTLSRTWTLPAATNFYAGESIRVVDQAGAISGTNTLVLLCSGADTVNGAASITLTQSHADVLLSCDGSGHFTVDVQGISRGGTGATTAPAALTNLGAAPLASPALTGNPTAPTPSIGDNDTSIATTAFVATSYAPLNSPSFSGTPTAPTPTAGDSSTDIATTAFVATSFAPLASPVLTGNPTAPTPTAGDNDTSISTTAFVNTAITGNKASGSNLLAGADDVKYLTAKAVKDAAAPQSVAYAATVTIDLSLGIDVTLGSVTGALTLANPTNAVVGYSGCILLPIGTTARTLGKGTSWLFPGGAPTTSGSGSTDAIFYKVMSSTQILACYVNGYA